MKSKRNKRTKRAYQDLFDNPASIFGAGATVTLFPDGANEIWIKSHLGTFRITAGHGRAGFEMRVSSCVGDPQTDVHILDRPSYITTIAHDVREVTVIQYHDDPYSQAFKAWYESECDANGKHTSPHPDEIGLTPVFGSNGVRIRQVTA